MKYEYMIFLSLHISLKLQSALFWNDSLTQQTSHECSSHEFAYEWNAAQFYKYLKLKTILVKCIYILQRPPVYDILNFACLSETRSFAGLQ